MRKRSTAEAERDALHHAVGGIARVCFFYSYSFINSSFFCVSPVDSTPPNQHFFLETLQGAPSALFLFLKTPRVGCKRPGALFRNCFMERPGGRLLRSVRYVPCTFPKNSHTFTCTTFYIKVYRTRLGPYRLRVRSWADLTMVLGYTNTTMCCVLCVFFPLILDIKYVGRTSWGYTGFFIHLLSAVRALFFLARRIQPFLSLVDREVEFCVLTI